MFIYNTKERVETVLDDHAVDVVELLHHQLHTLVGAGTHHCGTGIGWDGVAARQDFQSIFLPEHVDAGSAGVEPIDWRSTGSSCDFAVLVLNLSIGRCGNSRDDRRANHHLSAVGDADDTEGLQFASGLFGDVMHCVNAINRKRIASNNADRVGHGDSLVAVVHVDLATHGSGSSLRHVLSLRGRGVDRSGSTSSRSDAVCVVEFVRVKTCDHADEVALISLVRLSVAKRPAGLRQITGQAVVVAARQSQEAVKVGHALLVHDGIAQGNVIIITGSSSNRNDQRALGGCGVHDGHVDVGCELLLR